MTRAATEITMSPDEVEGASLRSAPPMQDTHIDSSAEKPADDPRMRCRSLLR